MEVSVGGEGMNDEDDGWISNRVSETVGDFRLARLAL